MLQTARRAAIRAAALVLSLTAWALCLAQGASAPTADSTATVFEAAQKAARNGPVDLPLAAKGVLKLPDGMTFVPQPQAGALLRAMGNPGQDPRLQGLIFPRGGGDWFMTVRYEDSGHIADDDARDWNADELLKNYREGTEAANDERRKMGAVPIEVLGWAEKPRYDANTHQLQWAMSSREKVEKGAPADQPQGVNFNTYVLGREGYFTMNLVTALAHLPEHKPQALALLQALQFNEGQRYTDYSASTDRTAEYGLAALVVGVAAKKLGLLALAGVFFAKFAKVILLVLALLGGVVSRVLKRRKTVAAAASAEPPHPSP